MKTPTSRLAVLVTVCLLFGVSFAGGFYTQASLTDRESVGGSIEAAGNFAGNTVSATAGTDDATSEPSSDESTDTTATDTVPDDGTGAGNTDTCTGNESCEGSLSGVGSGSDLTVPVATRVGG